MMTEVSTVELTTKGGATLELEIAWVPVACPAGGWAARISQAPYSHSHNRVISWEQLDSLAGVGRADLERIVEND